mmetsp:Transcript_46451/g.90730  ORF Transcript_46451/g.90730 Transcript_46451/m.90730 type:complete len:218 (+) Transcript_46451:1324-1977(+)
MALWRAFSVQNDTNPAFLGFPSTLGKKPATVLKPAVIPDSVAFVASFAADCTDLAVRSFTLTRDLIGLMPRTSTLLLPFAFFLLSLFFSYDSGLEPSLMSGLESSSILFKVNFFSSMFGISIPPSSKCLFLFLFLFPFINQDVVGPIKKEIDDAMISLFSVSSVLPLPVLLLFSVNPVLSLPDVFFSKQFSKSCEKFFSIFSISSVIFIFSSANSDV